MKPASMKKFDLFYLGSIVVGMIGIILNFESLQRQANAEIVASGLESLGSGILIASLVVGVGLNLLIWFVISVLRIELFKWVLVAIVVYGIYSLAASFGALMGFGSQAILALISTALSIAALFYLFRPDSTAWFAAKYDGVDDPE